MIRGLAFLGAVLGISLAAAQGAVAASRSHIRHQGPRLGSRCRYGTGRRLRLREARLWLREDPRALLPRHGATRRPRCSRSASSSPTARATSRSRQGRRSACGMPSGNSYPLAAGTYTLGPSLKLRVEASGRPEGASRPAAVHPGAAAARARARLPRLDPGQVARAAACRRSTSSGSRTTCAASSRRRSAPRWPIEALKAQAVASRAFAVATKKDSGSFDVYAGHAQPGLRRRERGAVLDQRRRPGDRGQDPHLSRAARAHLLLRLVGRPDGRRPGRLPRLEARCVSASRSPTPTTLSRLTTPGARTCTAQPTSPSGSG